VILQGNGALGHGCPFVLSGLHAVHSNAEALTFCSNHYFVSTVLLKGLEGLGCRVCQWARAFVVQTAPVGLSYINLIALHLVLSNFPRAKLNPAIGKTTYFKEHDFSLEHKISKGARLNQKGVGLEPLSFSRNVAVFNPPHGRVALPAVQGLTIEKVRPRLRFRRRTSNEHEKQKKL
jgi:hypothetical protein